MRRAAHVKQQIWRVEGEQARRAADRLAIEEPLEIQLAAGSARQTLAITMRTPGDDYDLVAGFLYAEGIITAKHDIAQMVYCVDGQPDHQQYNALRVTLHAAALPDLPQLDRYFFTNSACGVCGRAMLDELAARPLPPLTPMPPIAPAVLAGLPATLRQAQQVFDATGGLHAAALFDREGTLLALREDVGRHNALDKLIGWGVRERRLPFGDQIILVSGRAGYELLHKCRVAGASIFCAVSAPSSLAVDLAQRFDITLVGFLRGPRFNIYTRPERIRKAEDLPQRTQRAQKSEEERQ
ncbi:MAG: formate dehydrogenase accessory sulfurtransferase FdhD [Caldilineaceae bacterium]|nr:formate dehydrogenase accessory sulfurtransferase FdhD [Caldilineaceae bacterium]